MRLIFLFFLLPLTLSAQTVTNVSGLAWCYAHGDPVVMVTNRVISDVGTAELGGIQRTQTLDLKCPKCGVHRTVSRMLWVPVSTPPTNRFQDRNIQWRTNGYIVFPSTNAYRTITNGLRGRIPVSTNSPAVR